MPKPRIKDPTAIGIYGISSNNYIVNASKPDVRLVCVVQFQTNIIATQPLKLETPGYAAVNLENNEIYDMTADMHAFLADRYTEEEEKMIRKAADLNSA